MYSVQNNLRATPVKDWTIIKFIYNSASAYQKHIHVLKKLREEIGFC